MEKGLLKDKLKKKKKDTLEKLMILNCPTKTVHSSISTKMVCEQQSSFQSMSSINFS